MVSSISAFVRYLYLSCKPSTRKDELMPPLQLKWLSLRLGVHPLTLSSAYLVAYLRLILRLFLSILGRSGHKRREARLLELVPGRHGASTQALSSKSAMHRTVFCVRELRFQCFREPV